MASFPYWLKVTMTAISPETNLPELISQTYRLDHLGTFHQDIPQGHRTLLAQVDEFTAMRLYSPLGGTEVAYVASRTAVRQS